MIYMIYTYVIYMIYMCSNLFKSCSNMCKCFPMCSNVLVLAVTSGSGRVLGGNGFFGGNGCFLVVTSDYECL